MLNLDPSLVVASHAVACIINFTTSYLRRRKGLCRSMWSAFIEAYIALYDVVILSNRPLVSHPGRVFPRGAIKKMKPISIPRLISLHIYCIFEDLLTWVWTSSVSAHVITNVSMIKLNNWRVIQTCLKMRYPSSFTWRDAITQLAATLLQKSLASLASKKMAAWSKKELMNASSEDEKLLQSGKKKISQHWWNSRSQLRPFLMKYWRGQKLH